MIVVNVYYFNNNIYKIEVSGHAGYQKHGKDIVCAACSVLTINSLNAIEQFTDEKISVDFSNEEYIIAEFENGKQGNMSNDAKIILDTLMLGLSDLEYEYGKHIKINRRCQND